MTFVKRRWRQQQRRTPAGRSASSSCRRGSLRAAKGRVASRPWSVCLNQQLAEQRRRQQSQLHLLLGRTRLGPLMRRWRMLLSVAPALKSCDPCSILELQCPSIEAHRA